MGAKLAVQGIRKRLDSAAEGKGLARLGYKMAPLGGQQEFKADGQSGRSTYSG